MLTETQQHDLQRLYKERRTEPDTCEAERHLKMHVAPQKARIGICAAQVCVVCDIIPYALVRTSATIRRTGAPLPPPSLP